jgi:hypothetical protein
VDINIPAYHLELIQDDTLARACVSWWASGRVRRPCSPTRVVYVDVNPTWTLPPSVVERSWFRDEEGSRLPRDQPDVRGVDQQRQSGTPWIPNAVPWEMAGSTASCISSSSRPATTIRSDA